MDGAYRCHSASNGASVLQDVWLCDLCPEFSHGQISLLAFLEVLATYCWYRSDDDSHLEVFPDFLCGYDVRRVTLEDAYHRHGIFRY